MVRSSYRVIYFAYFYISAAAKLELPVTILVLNNNIQYYRRYGNEINWLLEQRSSEVILVGNPSELSAFRK